MNVVGHGVYGNLMMQELSEKGRQTPKRWPKKNLITGLQ